MWYPLSCSFTVNSYLVLVSMAFRNLSLSEESSPGWIFSSASVRVTLALLWRTLYLEHILSVLIRIDHHFFLILVVNSGTVRVGGGLSLRNAFGRAFISVVVDVAGVREGTDDAGDVLWCWKRAMIRSIYCFYMVMKFCYCFVRSGDVASSSGSSFIHGLHEGVQADALKDSLFKWFWGWDGRTQCRRSCLG